MAPHSSTLAWKISWTEEPGRLQSMGSQSRTRLSDFTFSFFLQNQIHQGLWDGPLSFFSLEKYWWNFCSFLRTPVCFSFLMHLGEQIWRVFLWIFFSGEIEKFFFLNREVFFFFKKRWLISPFFSKILFFFKGWKAQISSAEWLNTLTWKRNKVCTVACVIFTEGTKQLKSKPPPPTSRWLFSNLRRGGPTQNRK